MPESPSHFQRALHSIFNEIINGASDKEGFVLNPGDPGFIRQLESVDAQTASTSPMPGQTTIAAHVDHVLYGMTLLNRWADGEENPWANADWSASWHRTTVSHEQWRTLIDQLRAACDKWRQTLASRTEWNDTTASGAIASAVHTAYHIGAIRQILAASGKPPIA